jgi:transposase
LIMQRGRPLRDLILNDEERTALQRWVRRPKSAQRLVERANIVLLSGKGLSNETVAERVGVSGATVCKWRERFRTMRLQGLSDAPRAGPPRLITDDRVD